MDRFLVYIVILIVPLGLLLGLVLSWRFLFDRDRRRSPLNFKLLNLPGDGLRARIAENEEKMLEASTMALLAGPLMFAGWSLERLRSIPGAMTFRPGDLIFVVAALAAVAWAASIFVRHGRKRRRYRQGLEAERATAQSLMPLMAEGCIVFHDFPGDKFNIDHIVVAPHVVFAIETKSRRKPSTGGKAAARVGYDGRLLTFPTHAETKPVEQAKAQAEWLKRFITGAVGEPIPVLPVLSLPGWYVDLSKEGSRADVIVANLRNPAFLLKFGPVGQADLVRQRRIAHALTERYPAAED